MLHQTLQNIMKNVILNFLSKSIRFCSGMNQIKNKRWAPLENKPDTLLVTKIHPVGKELALTASLSLDKNSKISFDPSPF